MQTPMSHEGDPVQTLDMCSSVLSCSLKSSGIDVYPRCFPMGKIYSGRNKRGTDNIKQRPLLHGQKVIDLNG